NLGWFGDFTDKVVRRYKDVIGHWEMWNEPYGWGFWAGTAEEYVELERLGFLAAKQADPACRVVGMCVYPGVRDWIEAAVAAGGLRWMDILSFHVYLTPSLVSIGDSGRSPLEDMVLYLCSLLREAGRADTPIWDTEGGVGCPSFYSWLPPDGWSVSSQDAASTVVKACAQLMGQGVEKWFYYFVGFSQGGSNSYYRMNNISYVEMDIDGSPKATLLAHAAAARLLDERPFVSRIVARGWTAYVFDDRGKGLAVVWARQENGSHPTELLDLGSVVGPVEVIDLMGRSKGSMSAIELDVTPVYLRSTASPTALAKALRGIAQRGDRSAR
ncbi:MAG: hypothetical protein H5T86_10335, partial [Armatimonadetes bacterium]|nr:hypothetical protein [Armatimonadota bacterium]